jgi:formylglycine-generating enzyme required for sulfatase activity
MVLIPAGPFIMGSDRVERDFGYGIGGEAARRYRWFDRWELPRQEVNLPVYCMQKFPVMNEAYRQFVDATGHHVPFISSEAYRRQGYLVHPYKEVERFLWHQGRYPEGTGTSGRPGQSGRRVRLLSVEMEGMDVPPAERG